MLEFDGTILIAAISFILFMIVMNWIFYAPMQKIVDERNLYIQANNRESDEFLAESKDILHQRDEAILRAQTLAREKLSDGVDASKRDKSEALAVKMTESRNIIDSEKSKLQNEEMQLKETLKGNVADLSKDIAEKLLNTPIENIEYVSEIVDGAINNV